MARRAAPGTLIHCESCGEDYSATYKRCPFCGEKPGGGTTTVRLPRMDAPEQPEDDFVFEGQDLFDDGEEEAPRRPARPKGGKRLAQDGGRPSGGAPGPINWPRLITYLCGLVIIAAALVIVFAYIYPRIHAPSADPGSSPDTVSPPPSSVLPSGEPGSSDPVPGTSTAPSGQPGGTVTGLILDNTDFTLQPNESATIHATVTPADWGGTVTWTSSDPSLATVSADGTVTNVNSGDTLLRVTITATAGDMTATASVYCRGGSTGPAPSTGPDGGDTPTTGAATIANAASGLRVRSGPGTSYDVVASLRNGDDIVVVADAGDGWYEITFAGSGGQDTTGYIMGEYISMS